MKTLKIEIAYVDIRGSHKKITIDFKPKHEVRILDGFKILNDKDYDNATDQAKQKVVNSGKTWRYSYSAVIL